MSLHNTISREALESLLVGSDYLRFVWHSGNGGLKVGAQNSVAKFAGGKRSRGNDDFVTIGELGEDDPNFPFTRGERDSAMRALEMVRRWLADPSVVSITFNPGSFRPNVR